MAVVAVLRRWSGVGERWWLGWEASRGRGQADLGVGGGRRWLEWWLGVEGWTTAMTGDDAAMAQAGSADAQVRVARDGMGDGTR